MLYGSGMRAAVAVRLKNQINENAKMAAFAGAVPEIAHNEILGWLQAHARDAAARRGVPPRLRRVARRRDALRRAWPDSSTGDGAKVETWAAEGPDERARAFGLLLFGDLVSCHLADIEGVDPMDIARLTRLKAALAADR